MKKILMDIFFFFCFEKQEHLLHSVSCELLELTTTAVQEM